MLMLRLALGRAWLSDRMVTVVTGSVFIGGEAIEALATSVPRFGIEDPLPGKVPHHRLH